MASEELARELMRSLGRGIDGFVTPSVLSSLFCGGCLSTPSEAVRILKVTTEPLLELYLLRFTETPKELEQSRVSAKKIAPYKSFVGLLWAYLVLTFTVDDLEDKSIESLQRHIVTAVEKNKILAKAFDLNFAAKEDLATKKQAIVDKIVLELRNQFPKLPDDMVTINILDFAKRVILKSLHTPPTYQESHPLLYKIYRFCETANNIDAKHVDAYVNFRRATLSGTPTGSRQVTPSQSMEHIEPVKSQRGAVEGVESKPAPQPPGVVPSDLPELRAQ